MLAGELTLVFVETGKEQVVHAGDYFYESGVRAAKTGLVVPQSARNGTEPGAAPKRRSVAEERWRPGSSSARQRLVNTHPSTYVELTRTWGATPPGMAQGLAGLGGDRTVMR